MKRIVIIPMALIITSMCLMVSCTPSAPTSKVGNPKLGQLQGLYPKATEADLFEPQMQWPGMDSLKKVSIWQLRNTSESLGYCLEAQVKARSGPFMIQVCVDSGLTIKQTKVLSYPWQRGRNVCKPEFTGQFTGKTPASPLDMDHDIDSITSATLSSRAMTNGVRNAIKLLQHIQENQ